MFVFFYGGRGEQSFGDNLFFFEEPAKDVSANQSDGKLHHILFRNRSVLLFCNAQQRIESLLNLFVKGDIDLFYIETFPKQLCDLGFRPGGCIFPEGKNFVVLGVR